MVPAQEELPPPPPMPAPMAAAPQPAPMQAPQHDPRQRMAMPRGPQLQPIDPNLPPDTPLEPGSGVPRSRPGSAAARIAASEAALASTKPLVTAEADGKSNFIAAARRAARAANSETANRSATAELAPLDLR